MDSPRTRFYVRLLAVGIVAFASALQAHLPGLSGEDWLESLITVIVAVGAYAGIGVATPLEPSVGPQPKPIK